MTARRENLTDCLPGAQNANPWTHHPSFSSRLEIRLLNWHGKLFLGLLREQTQSSVRCFKPKRSDTDRTRHYLQNPYYFMCCSLHDAIEDEPVPAQSSTPLAGTLVSSLHRLKDLNNEGRCSEPFYFYFFLLLFHAIRISCSLSCSWKSWSRRRIFCLRRSVNQS